MNLMFKAVKKKRESIIQVADKKNVAAIETRHIIRDFVFILLGILSAGFGLKGFLLPNTFIDGGVMGISLIIAELSDLPLSILIVGVNLPFSIMGFSTIGRQFALKSIVAIALLATAGHFIP